MPDDMLPIMNIDRFAPNSITEIVQKDFPNGMK